MTSSCRCTLTGCCSYIRGVSGVLCVFSCQFQFVVLWLVLLCLCVCIFSSLGYFVLGYQQQKRPVSSVPLNSHSVTGPSIYSIGLNACPHLFPKQDTLYPETGDFVFFCIPKRDILLPFQATSLSETANLYPETEYFVSGNRWFCCRFRQQNHLFPDTKYPVLECGQAFRPTLFTMQLGCRQERLGLLLQKQYGWITANILLHDIATVFQSLAEH